MAKTPIIEIKGLQTRFGNHIVHDNLDMIVEQGEILSIIGGSGTGKTTLIRQILGLERPAKGTVKVFGEDVHKANEEQLQSLRNRWGMLFQQGALFSALTEAGYECNLPQGAFYLFFKAPGGNSEEFSERAKEQGLLIVPADSFGAKGYIRIATCVKPETIKRAIPLFRKLMSFYAKKENFSDKFS